MGQRRTNGTTGGADREREGVEWGRIGEKDQNSESRRQDRTTLPWTNWRDIAPWPASRRAIAPGLTQGRRGQAVAGMVLAMVPSMVPSMAPGSDMARSGMLFHCSTSRPMAPGKQCMEGEGGGAGRPAWRTSPCVDGAIRQSCLGSASLNICARSDGRPAGRLGKPAQAWTDMGCERGKRQKAKGARGQMALRSDGRPK